jgi:hypothetical protein
MIDDASLLAMREVDYIKYQAWATARREIRRHARIHGATAEDFERRYGWRVDRLAEDLLLRGCGCCNRESLGAWLWIPRLTFNVIDTAKPPDYPSNVELLCPLCTKAMRDDPVFWRSYSTKWKRNRVLRESTPMRPV